MHECPARAANAARIWKPRPDTYGCNSLVREVVHASRTTGQDDHLKALTGTTDVQGHAVRRGNSQLIYVPQSCRESGWMAPAHRHERSRPPRRITASAQSAEGPSTPAKSLRSTGRRAFSSNLPSTQCGPIWSSL